MSTTILFLLLLGKLFVTVAAVAAAWAWLRFDPLEQEFNLADRTPVVTLVVVAVLPMATSVTSVTVPTTEEAVAQLAAMRIALAAAS